MAFPVTTLLPTSILMVVCKRASLAHIITFALFGFVLLTSTPSNWKAAGNMCPPDLEVTESTIHMAFWVIKKWSIAIAYTGLVLMSIFPRSRAIGWFFAFCVSVNVVQAAVIAAIDHDWVGAIAGFIFGLFYPIQRVLGDMWTHDEEAKYVWGLLPVRMWMDARTFVRWYTIVLSALYLFGATWAGAADGCSHRIYMTSTCIVALFSMEMDSERSPCSHFMIRGFGIFWGIIIDSAIDHRFFNRMDAALLPTGYDEFIRNHVLLRNGLQAAFIVLCLSYFRVLLPSSWSRAQTRSEKTK